MIEFVDYDSYMDIDKSGIDYKEPIFLTKKRSSKIKEHKFFINKKFKIKDKKHLFIKSALNYFYYPYFNTDRKIPIFRNLLNKNVLKLNSLSVQRLHRRVNDLNESFIKVYVPVQENFTLECNKYDYLIIQNKDVFFYGHRVTDKFFCDNIYLGSYEPYMKNYKSFYSEKEFYKYAHKVLKPHNNIDYYIFDEESFGEEMNFEEFENELLDKHYAADYFDYSTKEEPLDYWLTVNDFNYGCKYDITYHISIDMNEQKARDIYLSRKGRFINRDDNFAYDEEDFDFYPDPYDHY